MTATVKNHKRIIAVILMIIIAAVFTAVPQETHAASKVKSMTAYNKIYKCGSKVYCNDHYYVTKANLKNPKAKAKKLFDVG